MSNAAEIQRIVVAHYTRGVRPRLRWRGPLPPESLCGERPAEWTCFGYVGDFHLVGFGPSPAEAWHDWLFQCVQYHRPKLTGEFAR